MQNFVSTKHQRCMFNMIIIQHYFDYKIVSQNRNIHPLCRLTKIRLPAYKLGLNQVLLVLKLGYVVKSYVNLN